MASESRINVVVVGAGVAGLAAAWRLHQLGHEVSVLERGERSGGRFGGEWIEGFCIDRSLQTLHTGDRWLLAWIEELGLRDTLLPLRALQLAQVDRGVSAPIDPQSLMGVASMPGIGLRGAAKLLRWDRLMARYRPLLDAAAPERAESLDYRSVADFARLYFGDRVSARWLAPEVVESFGGSERELSRVSALLIWASRRTGSAGPVLHGLPRSGLQEVVSRAEQKLAIRHAVEATRIDEAPAGGFTVECRGLAGGRGMLDADAVVIATGAGEAGRIAQMIVSPAERDYLAGVRCGPEIVLSAALDRAPCGMPQRVRVPHCERLPFDSVLLAPGLAGGRAPQGAGLVTLRASDEVVAKRLWSGLERLFPALAGSLQQSRLFRREAALARFDVGAYRAIARFRRVQADRRALARRLYFAGDYLIGPRAEDAVVAGRRAADDLEADLRAA